MKRKQTALSPRDRIKDLLRRAREYKPPHGEFRYDERGQKVTEAHTLFNEACDLRRRFPADCELLEAVTTMRERWFEAMAAAYPHGFWGDVEKLRAGDAAGLESVLGFLEADPFFFGTGYEKAKLIRAIKPAMLTPRDKTRLQGVVLSLVDRRDDRDFRAFCNLARKVDGPELREGLAQRLTSRNPDTSPDLDVRRRARWVLDTLAQKDSMEQKDHMEQGKKL